METLENDDIVIPRCRLYRGRIILGPYQTPNITKTVFYILTYINIPSKYLAIPSLPAFDMYYNTINIF
jgi:hypothetical protein